MKKIKKQIKCKDCPYYSGLECHGHGEYYGTCRYLEQLRIFFAKINNVYKYDIKLKKYETLWAEALNDESTCLIYEIEDIVNENESENN